eukprot:TRINITY_DN4472_c1_g1_i1.p1 TRINITY_DN4472_c1_g1~~TRINITY_DN4472_c1_g1_i1.p1  ORF type:complete len:507 (+),score=119.32 TRINITY_DN4472_c1_g1_i1:80-1600(+)
MDVRPKHLLTLALFSSAISKATASSLKLWQSAVNTDDRIAQKDDVNFGSDFDFAGPTLKISDQKAQTITGFGGAFTEASGKVFKQLSSDQQKQMIEDYFGPSGNHYTLGRTHINSCDFSVDSYSYDDVDGDMLLQQFNSNLTRDTEALIPLIKAAQQALQQQGRDLKLLASPWSPPAWMKNNNQMDNSFSPCLKDGMAPVWAKYFTKWISAYKAQDIPIWAVTVQNEPENNASWEACLMTADEEADFLGKHLGPELAQSFPEVGIFAFDHNKDHVYNWAQTILSDPDASKYATGIAFHWYSGDGFEAVENITAQFPKAQLLASEATWEAYRWHPGTKLQTGDWSFGEGYGHDIIGDLNAGTIGWIDWNLILDEHGGPNHVDNVCDSAMQVNFTRGEVYKHPQYYYIGHFSRFILPGSVRLVSEVTNSNRYTGITRAYGSCTKEDGLQGTSFLRSDGKVVAVAMNCGDDPLEFKLQYGSNAVKLSLPAHGIQTYVFDSEESAAEIVV